MKLQPIYIVVEIDTDGPSTVSHTSIPNRPEGTDELRYHHAILPILRALHLLARDTRTVQRIGQDHIPALRLAADLLHPEAYGWAVPPEISRHARRVLGQEVAS